MVNTTQLKELRIANLWEFVQRKFDGNKSAAARAYGCEPQQMNDLLAGRKSFGEKVVRRCQETMGIPVGYLDTPNAAAVFFENKEPPITGRQWPFSLEHQGFIARWNRLTPGQRMKIEGEIMLLMEAFERDEEPASIRHQEARGPLQRHGG